VRDDINIDTRDPNGVTKSNDNIYSNIDTSNGKRNY